MAFRARLSSRIISRTGMLRAGAAVVLAPLLVGANPFSDDLQSRALMVHNVERSRLGIDPLTWDSNLEKSAQRWADHLAATGRFEHAPDGAGDPQGENLWAGTRGAFSVEAMVSAWIREKQHFRPAVFPNNSTTGRIADVSHYTQVVWRETGQVGCAKATGQAEDVFVCRYAQAGNYIGERPY